MQQQQRLSPIRRVAPPQQISTRLSAAQQQRRSNRLGSRITASSIFSCEDITRFIDSIVNILPYRGYSNSRFFTCELNNIRFLTKLCFYHKSQPELYDATSEGSSHQTDAEIRILDLFRRRLIDENITPCILELIYSHECPSIEQLYPSEDECEIVMRDYRNTAVDSNVYDMLCGYRESVRAGLAFDRAAFLVLERCDMTLEDYLQKSVNTPVSLSILKTLLFQIIYTVWAICRLWPRFSHLDLHTENIMLKFDSRYRFQATDPKFIVFFVDGRRYTVPYFGIIPKLIDFGFSSVPEEGIISNITDDRLMMSSRGGNDLIYLFHWIQRSLFGDEPKRDRVRELLTSLVTDEAYIYAVDLKRADLPTAHEMLIGGVFDEYVNFEAPPERIYATYDEPQRQSAAAR